MAYINRSIFPIGVNKPGTNTTFLDGKVSNLMPLPQTSSAYYQRTKHLRSDISLATQNVFSYNPEINTTLPSPPPPPQPPTNYSLRLLFNNITNANTLVGDASNVSNWNTFFDLPNYGNPFVSVTIVGNEVQLFGGSNIEIKSQLFSDNQDIIEVNDDGALIIIGIGAFGSYTSFSNLTTIVAPNVTTILGSPGLAGAFSFCSYLSNVNLPNCINIGEAAFYTCQYLESPVLAFDQITSIGSYAFTQTNIIEINYPVLTDVGIGAFGGCQSIISIDLPLLTEVNDSVFAGCISITTINIPLATTIGYDAFRECQSVVIFDFPFTITVGDNAFENCSSAEIINLPVCTNLGGTVGYNAVFQSITGNTITLTVPSALMTCNSGDPDGDIQYLQANNTVTVITV